MSRIVKLEDEILGLIAAACDETATPEQIIRLEECLRGDPELMKVYLDYCLVHQEMVLCERADFATRKVIEDIGLSQTASATTSSDRLGSYQRNWRVLAATAALALFAVSMTVFLESPRHANGLSQQSADSDDYPYAARVTQIFDAKWNGKSYSVGDELMPGQRLQFESGYAEIAFATDAVVMLKGPMNFQVNSEGSGQLDRGSLVAQVPEQAQGFLITTPAANLVDLGTEYAVNVRESREIDVHVYDGEVELNGLDQSGQSSKPRILRTDEHVFVNTKHLVQQGEPLARESLFPTAAMTRAILVNRQSAEIVRGPNGRYFIRQNLLATVGESTCSAGPSSSRFCLSFVLSAADRSSILNAESISLDIPLNRKQGSGEHSVKLIGLGARNSPKVRVKDFMRSGTLLESRLFKDDRDFRSVDITDYVQKLIRQSDKSTKTVSLRLQVGPREPSTRDATKDAFNFHGPLSKRRELVPALTIRVRASKPTVL